jgi:hypothetical protein
MQERHKELALLKEERMLHDSKRAAKDRREVGQILHRLTERIGVPLWGCRQQARPFKLGLRVGFALILVHTSRFGGPGLTLLLEGSNLMPVAVANQLSCSCGCLPSRRGTRAQVGLH